MTVITNSIPDSARVSIFSEFLYYEADEEEASVNPCEDEDNGTSSSANVKKDLSDWQEKHAVLVLSKSKVFLQFFFSLLFCDRPPFQMIND